MATKEHQQLRLHYPSVRPQVRLGLDKPSDMLQSIHLLLLFLHDALQVDLIQNTTQRFKINLSKLMGLSPR